MAIRWPADRSRAPQFTSRLKMEFRYAYVVVNYLWCGLGNIRDESYQPSYLLGVPLKCRLLLCLLILLKVLEQHQFLVLFLYAPSWPRERERER